MKNVKILKCVLFLIVHLAVADEVVLNLVIDESKELYVTSLQSFTVREDAQVENEALKCMGSMRREFFSSHGFVNPENNLWTITEERRLLDGRFEPLDVDSYSYSRDYVISV